jgi:hypothetical protein
MTTQRNEGNSSQVEPLPHPSQVKTCSEQQDNSSFNFTPEMQQQAVSGSIALSTIFGIVLLMREVRLLIKPKS